MLLAATAAAVTVYLATGYLVGVRPDLQFRPRARTRDTSSAQVWLTQAGLHLSPLRFRLWSGVAGAVAFAMALALTGAFWVAVPPAVVTALAPRWYFAKQRIRRLSEVQEAWPDGLRHLIASVRSGLSLPAALDQLAHTGPDGLLVALERYHSLARAFGVKPALEVMRDELGDPTTDRVVEVLILAYERGGPLVADILHDLAEATSQDIRTLAEIRTNSLEHRLNARIVFAVPWLVLVLLTARPSAYRDFYRSSAGLLVVIVAGMLSLVGAWWVARLGREPVEVRVFGNSTAEAVR